MKWTDTKGCACATLDNTETPAGAFFGEHTPNVSKCTEYHGQNRVNTHVNIDATSNSYDNSIES